jgi:hypothetical protein
VGWQPRAIEDEEDDDDLAPAYGCLAACLIALVLWSLAVVVIVIVL